MKELFFYLFAANVLGSALWIMLSGNVVRSTILLIYCFFSCAALWVVLNADYIAILLVLVYVGAVMVLFIFVIMLVNAKHTVIKRSISLNLLLFLILLFLIGVQISGLLLSLGEIEQIYPHSMKSLGLLMYTEYVVEVQLGALLLLCGMIAAIVLNLKNESGPRHQQNVSKQVRVTPKERIKIVKMDYEMGQKQDQR